MNLIDSNSDMISIKLVDCETIKEVLYVKIRLNNKTWWMNNLKRYLQEIKKL